MKKLTAFQHNLLNGIDGSVLKHGLPLAWRAHLNPASRRALDTLITRELVAAEGDNYVITAAGKAALAQHAGTTNAGAANSAMPACSDARRVEPLIPLSEKQCALLSAIPYLHITDATRHGALNALRMNDLVELNKDNEYVVTDAGKRILVRHAQR